MTLSINKLRMLEIILKNYQCSSLIHHIMDCQVNLILHSCHLFIHASLKLSKMENCFVCSCNRTSFRASAFVIPHLNSTHNSYNNACLTFFSFFFRSVIFQHGELLNRGHAAPLPLPVSSIISILNKENYLNFSNLCCLVIGGWSSCTCRLWVVASRGPFISSSCCGYLLLLQCRQLLKLFLFKELEGYAHQCVYSTLLDCLI